MIRGNQFHRRQTIAIVTLALSLGLWAGTAESAPATGGKGHRPTASAKQPPAVQTAVRYAEALAHGDRVTAASSPCHSSGPW